MQTHTRSESSDQNDKKVSIAHMDTTHNTDFCLFCGITRLSKHMNPTYFLLVFQKLL